MTFLYYCTSNKVTKRLYSLSLLKKYTCVTVTITNETNIHRYQFITKKKNNYNGITSISQPCIHIHVVFSEEIKAFSISTLDEAKGRRISGLKVIVVVGDCDSPAFIDESREYAQVLTIVY